jgi:hypothetical protein
VPTRSELAREVNNLYRSYGNDAYYRPCFGRVRNDTLLKLIRLHRDHDNRTPITRPPGPAMKVLRGDAYDEYKRRMERYFIQAGAGVSVHELSVPQTEIIANFLAGNKNPSDRSYHRKYRRISPRQQPWERQLIATLENYACKDVFPLRLTGICKKDCRRIFDFLTGYTVQQRIRPPLPKQKKLFLENYYQYRRRAQAFFNRAAFPVPAERLSLPQIEALLNFMVGRKHPKKSVYQKVFAANARRPVDYFISMYKPFENPRYPISPGQYHGRRDEITPLLYFRPVETVNRWFPPPPSTKIRAGRRRLFLDYRVYFERLGVPVSPERLPIAYIEAVANFAQSMPVQKRDDKSRSSLLRAG